MAQRSEGLLVNTTSAATAEAGLATFDRTTVRWGRLTMIGGLLVSLAAPVYLVFFAGLDLQLSHILVAFVAVAGVFGVLWIVEPLTYFPILGQSAMYQAFMIGNISNKLLPAAIMAQISIDAKPGTRRGELAALMAISGAVAVHLTSLLIFVGILGTWLVSIIPADLLETIQTYIVPSVLGGVLIQAIVSQKAPRTTVVAFVLATLMTFVIIPLVPTMQFYGTIIVVFATAVIAWFIRPRTPTEVNPVAGAHGQDPIDNTTDAPHGEKGNA